MKITNIWFTFERVEERLNESYKLRSVCD